MYTDCADIIDAVVAVYDNTDESAVHNDTTRRERILHYLQRTAEDIWYSRSWPFSMTSDTLTMVAGESDYPDDYARISYEGVLLGPNGKPWVEISYQDMAYIRSRRIEQQRKYYALGSTIQVPDVNNTDNFVLIYQTMAPTLTDGDQAGDPTGFPAPFGEALLLGTVGKLREEEGDDRQIWRIDYQRALGRATGLWSRQTRAQRMPMTVGGGMW